MTLEAIEKILLARNPLPPLSPAIVFRADLSEPISRLPVEAAIQAGLHVLNDDLEAAHRLAQTEACAELNYWHAILHRREGDLDNASYWYRRIGAQQVLQDVSRTYPHWSPEWMIQAIREGSLPRETLEQIQYDEMKALLRCSQKGPAEAS